MIYYYIIVNIKLEKLLFKSISITYNTYTYITYNTNKLITKYQIMLGLILYSSYVLLITI